MDPPAACLSSKKKKKKIENKVGALCFRRSFAVFSCQSALLSVCLSTCFSIYSLSGSQTNRQDVEGCQWRSNVRAARRLTPLSFFMAHLVAEPSLPELYTPIITPPPPARAGRPWPYRPISFPRSNVTQGTPDI